MTTRNASLQTRKINLTRAPNGKKHTLDHYITIFDDYLKNQKGLSESYRHELCRIARLFLRSRFKSKAIKTNQIKFTDIRHFIYQYARPGSPYRTRKVAFALRSFLRFLKFMGKRQISPSFS